MPVIEDISDDEDATDAIPVFFMRCSGECLKEKAASTSRAVLARAAYLVQAAVGRHLPFELLSLTTWTQLDPTDADMRIAAEDAFAVLLRGQHFNLSPLCIGDGDFASYNMQYGAQRSAANVEWSREGVARRMGTRDDLFQLANRISLGGPLAPPRPPAAPEDPEEEDRELATTSFARISGLLSRPELNGEVAKMLAFNRAKGRWGVALVSSGERMLIKPANLEACADPNRAPMEAESSAAKDDVASYAGDEQPPDLPSDDELRDPEQAELEDAAADNSSLAADMASCYVHSGLAERYM